MAKKQKAAKRRITRKPAKTASRRHRKQSDDTTFKALMILGAIVIALAVMYLYVQNKKQAALLPDLGPALAALMGASASNACPSSASRDGGAVDPAGRAEVTRQDRCAGKPG